MSERYRDPVETRDREETLNVPLSDLKGKAIVTIDGGEKLGQVEDILIDRESMRVAAVISSQGTLLNKERKTIDAGDIATWGKDALLVRSRDAMRLGTERPESPHWLSVGNKLKGLSLVSTSGDRVGVIDDLIVDKEGRIVAYRVSEGRFSGDTRDVDARATRSIGTDAVIIDMDRSDRGTTTL